MCADTTKYAHFLVGKGFCDWKYALAAPEEQACSQVLSIGGKTTFLCWQDFCSYHIFNKKFLGTTKFGRAQKNWGSLPPTAPHGYRPAEETRAINETRRYHDYI